MVAVAYLPLQGVRLNASSIIVVQNGRPTAIVSGVRLIDLVEALLIDSGAFFFIRRRIRWYKIPRMARLSSPRKYG
jgi:hypothetical protein